jgi:hypothetical protein
MIDDLLQFYDGDIQVGQEWGVKKLDDHYPFKRNFSIHCGAAGSGKTDILLFMHFSQSYKNKKACIAYLDEGSMRMHYLRLIGMLYGKKLFERFYGNPKPKWYVSKDELMDGYNEVCKYVKIIDNQNPILLKNKTITSLINITENMASKDDIQSVLIDPKNAFSIDKEKGQYGAYEYDKVLLSDLREFQAKTNVKLDLVVHPSKGARMTKHMEGDKVRGCSVKGQPKPIDIWDAENGAVIEARTDDSLTFHRYRKIAELQTYTAIRVAKIKEQETGGKVTDDEDPIWVYKNNSTWRWIFDDVDLFGKVITHETPKEGSMKDELPF